MIKYLVVYCINTVFVLPKTENALYKSKAKVLVLLYKYLNVIPTYVIC